MNVRIKKLADMAVIPVKAHPSDAGFDLVATSFHFDPKAGNYIYGTGLAFEIPEGYVGLVFPRSSICKGDLMLTNAVGVIDSHYRGEVSLVFKSTVRNYSFWSLFREFFKRDKSSIKNVRIINSQNGKYQVGDRIGQIIIVPYPEVEFEEAQELTETDRGTGGYGSSGK